MKPVSFRAETMPDALAQARDQMGPDALVLTTRKVFDGPAWQVWRNPVFEVLVMPAAGTAGQPAEQPLAAKLAQDLAEVRAALGQVASQFEPAKSQWPDPLVALHKQLLAQEVDPDLALDICAAAKETLSPRALLDGAAVHAFAARHMLAQVRTAALVERSRRPQVVVLVGLTGAGKTTAAAKLAAHAQLVLGSITSMPLTLTKMRSAGCGVMVMSGSPKMTNKLPLPVFFKLSAMCRSAFIRAFKMGTRPILCSSPAWASKLKAQAITTSKPASAASRAASTKS